MNYSPIPQTKIFNERAKMLSIAGDPTRIRILAFMFRYGEACVSDIAKSLNMSVASTSHHLRIMHDNGFFETDRDGTSICYRLRRNEMTKDLQKLIPSAKVGKKKI